MRVLWLLSKQKGWLSPTALLKLQHRPRLEDQAFQQARLRQLLARLRQVLQQARLRQLLQNLFPKRLRQLLQRMRPQRLLSIQSA
jgi:hypothetical protein